MRIRKYENKKGPTTEIRRRRPASHTHLQSINTAGRPEGQPKCSERLSLPKLPVSRCHASASLEGRWRKVSAFATTSHTLLCLAAVLPACFGLLFLPFFHFLPFLVRFVHLFPSFSYLLDPFLFLPFSSSAFPRASYIQTDCSCMCAGMRH